MDPGPVLRPGHIPSGHGPVACLRQASMPLFVFFSLTFLVTWTSFIAAAALWRGGAPGLLSLGGPVFLLGVIAPSLVALM